MSDLYKDPLIQLVIDKLDADGPSKLQSRYINGDVLMPNQSELPIAYVAKDTVKMGAASNMEDEHIHSLVLTVILDMKQDLNEVYDMVAGTPELYEMVEARDDVTYQLKADTLLYNLRKSQQLADKTWIGVRDTVDVNYGIGIARRGPGIFSVEASIRFTVLQHLPRPGLT
jgi:hypothetical protein